MTLPPNLLLSISASMISRMKSLYGFSVLIKSCSRYRWSGFKAPYNIGY